MLEIKTFLKSSLFAEEHSALSFLDSCTVECELGKGSLGRVLHLRSNKNEAGYAVKITNRDAIENDPCKRALREASLAGSLDHPNIPKYHACVWDQLELKLVMDICPGLPLFRAIREHKGLPESSVKSVAGQVARALGYLHDKGTIYVDLKSENVIWDELSGRIYLVDFDLCHTMAEVEGLQAAEAASTESGSGSGETPSGKRFWGTEEYVSPEVLKGGRAAYSTASDWWALGVLCFEMLAGRTCFVGPSRERTFYNIANRSPEFPETLKISNVCRDFVRALLRHQSRYRLGTAGTQEVLGHAFLAKSRRS